MPDLRPPVVLAAYGLALALLFGAAVGVGHVVGPVGTAAAPEHAHDTPRTAHDDRTGGAR